MRERKNQEVLRKSENDGRERSHQPLTMKTMTTTMNMSDYDDDDLPYCQLLGVSSSRVSHDEAAQGGRDTVKSTSFGD